SPLGQAAEPPAAGEVAPPPPHIGPPFSGRPGRGAPERGPGGAGIAWACAWVTAAGIPAALLTWEAPGFAPSTSTKPFSFPQFHCWKLGFAAHCNRKYVVETD